MIRVIALLAVVLAVAGLGQARLAFAGGVGFFPAELSVTDGLRGQRYVSGTVIINQTNETRSFRLSSSGDLGPWISFANADEPDDLATEFVAPADGRLQLIVYISIPETTANGSYSGEILMENYAIDGQRLEVVQALQQGVTVTVSGTQVLRLRAGSAVANDVETGKILRVVTQVGNESNIDVAPTVTAEFNRLTEGGTPVEVIAGRARADGEIIPAAQLGTVTVAWDTADQPTGRYRATIKVSAQGQDFGTQALDFEILAKGSLVRGGSIASMRLIGDPPVGTVARVDIVFSNDGETDVVASFVGEVYRGSLIVSEADSKVDATAAVGQEAIISTFFPVNEPGTFILRGRVKYEGAQTEEAVLEFRVGSPDENNALLVQVALMTLGLMVVGGGAGLWWRRRGASSTD